MDGTPFGRYQLQALLGHGGMGEVWRAFDTATDRVVAVKVLPVHLANDQVFQQRFRREARAAAGLNEPHVVPIHDFGEIEGRLYVDMRLIEGRDLQTLLRDGPLEPVRAVRIIEQIASALRAAHRIGLVHRDVKPSNILITEDDFAYLIDFGIARAAGQAGLTSTGATIGTWSYMAPERLTGGTADARADVYALTCVLYQCLTAQLPYPGDSLEQQITGHLTVEPPKPSAINPAIPATFNEVIAHGMAKDPEQRYQTTRELASAASQALTEPLSGSAATVAAPAPRFPPATHDASQAATQHARAYPDPGYATPAPPTAGAPWAAGAGAGPQPLSPQPAGSGNRNRWLVLSIAAVVVAVVTGTGIYLANNHSNSNSAAPATSTTTAAAATTSTPPTPTVTVDALDGLLLSPGEIDTALGTTAMAVTDTWNTLNDDSDQEEPPECLAAAGALQAKVYAGSGWTASRGQRLQHTGYDVSQGVVLFPSAPEAAAFFSASSQNWPACSNHTYTITNAGQNPIRFTGGGVSSVNGTLSAINVQDGGSGWECQRALTASNNVVIDTFVCGTKLTDQAVSIANQIAAKVPR